VCGQGRVAESTEVLRESLALAPSATTGSTLLATLIFSGSVTAEQLRDEALAWAAAHAAPLSPAKALRKRQKDAPGRVRVGYLFGEFRSRAAVALLEALLTHHDRTRFHVT